MLDYQPNIVLSTQEYNVVGKRPIRPDGAEKVTGQAHYGTDMRLPGMVYGKILRSPHSHARIKSIDTRHAEELPGVHAVVTSGDLLQPSGMVVDLAEGVLHNMRFLSNNILAAEKVLYKGHAIAAVAATSPHVAEEALALIQVEYDVLPPVLDAKQAMQPGAPLLHERLAPLSNPSLRPGGFLSQDDPTPGTNIPNHFEFRLGDVDTGFQEADIIVENETSTAPIHQGYPVWPRVGFIETLQAAKDHPHYTAPLAGPYRGRGCQRGVSCAGGTHQPASPIARTCLGGSMGQGGSHEP